MKRILTIDPRIKTKTKDLPIDLPHIIRVNEFTEAAAKTFAEDMQKAHELRQHIIPVVIDSYGGMVDALIAMISEIQHSEVPVATICQGKAMSCGSVLLSCGAEGYRYIDPYSRIMIHDVSDMTFGKTEEIKADVAETDRLSKLIFHLMAKNCGQQKNFFLEEIHKRAHAEWYLTPTQAKKLNLVNHIKVPSFKIDVRVETEFG